MRLQYGAQIDHRVDVFAGAGAPQRLRRRIREKRTQVVQAGACCSVVLNRKRPTNSCVCCARQWPSTANSAVYQCGRRRLRLRAARSAPPDLLRRGRGWLGRSIKLLVRFAPKCGRRMKAIASRPTGDGYKPRPSLCRSPERDTSNHCNCRGRVIFCTNIACKTLVVHRYSPHPLASGRTYIFQRPRIMVRVIQNAPTSHCLSWV